MIDGRELARRLAARNDQLWRDERRVAAAIEDVVRIQTAQRTEEAKAWSRLGAMRLAEDGDALAGRMDAAAKEASSILQRRERRLDEIREHIADLDRQVETASLAHSQAEEAATDARAAAARRKADAIEALERDETCLAAAARVASLEAQVTKAEARAATTKDELEGKARPYLAEPTFAYLWERGYGTPAYRGTGIVRRLDGWVARLVGYETARRDFTNLNEIPRRLAAHAERLRATLSEARTRLDAASAVHTAEAEGAEDEARRLVGVAEAASKELRSLRDRLGRKGRDLRKAAERNDEDWHLASAALGRSLSTESLARIERAAAETPDTLDDLVVGEIRKARERTAEAERVATAKREELQRIRKRRKLLEGELEHLAEQGWDDENMLFADELGGKELSQMADGTTTGAGFRVKLQMSRRARPKPVVRQEPSWSGDAGTVWGRSERSESLPTGRRQDDDFRTGGGIGAGGGFVTGGVIGAIAGAAIGGADDAAASSRTEDFTTGGDF